MTTSTVVPAHLLAGEEQVMSVEERMAWMRQRDDWVAALPTPQPMPACPSWCDLGDGHDYPSVLSDLKTQIRYHSRELPGDVAITQEERYLDGTTTYGPVVVSRYEGDGFEELGSAAARAAGQALLAAADVLDEIEASA